MIIKTGRFGQLTVNEGEIIMIPQGVLGFPELTQYCLVDPADDTLIIWLQSLEKPEIVFPLLEPKIFRPSYTVKLSAAELRELRLDNVRRSAVFSILTIPIDISEMSANIKAPLVINLNERLAKQVVLQENDYSIKCLMFKELKSHLLTIGNINRRREPKASLSIPINDIPPSLTVRTHLAD